MMADKDDTFFRYLVENHVSGQLKVAPEHCSPNVLSYMGKPKIEVYEKFRKKFLAFSADCGKEQYIVPYLMSGHPGSTLEDAISLALYTKEIGLNPEQVQDFYPTPGSASTVMYYTGIDPFTGKKVHIPDAREKVLQRALLQYRRPENRARVREALAAAGRLDLIGNSPECLIRPAHPHGEGKGKPAPAAKKTHGGGNSDKPHTSRHAGSGRRDDRSARGANGKSGGRNAGGKSTNAARGAKNASRGAKKK